MTLYLDTSALVKLYVLEPHTEAVKAAVAGADAVAIAVVGYPEARAALARRHREGLLDGSGHENVKTALEGDWQTFMRLEVTLGMVSLAGGLAEHYALRGFDAVHLAAALMLQRERGDVEFLGYDGRLNDAARAVVPVYG